MQAATELPAMPAIKPEGGRRAKPNPLVDLVLGTDPALRTTLSLCLVMALVYIGWMLLIRFYLVPAGLCTLGEAHAFLIHETIAILLFYPLIRSGLTRRWADPGMVAFQVIWASSSAIIGYAIIPAMRPGDLQVLCLIQVFGFVSLKPRAATLTGCATIAMLVIMWSTMSARHVPNFDAIDEALKVGPTCFILGLLTWQSRNFGLARERMHHEKQNLAAAVEKVKQIALHDALTGLFNRQHLQTRIDAEHDRAVRSGKGFSIALIDLDHFKNVNDTHGHQVGDDVLVSFAERAQTILRETDVVGRWGGEEFVVVMPETDPAKDGVIGLNRLKQVLSSRQVSDRVPDLRVTFSAGVAAWLPGESAEQLVQRADQALYAAKAAGRNRSVIAETATG